MVEKNKRNPILLGEWFERYALEVELIDEQAFLKIMETLTRIGVSSNKDNKIFQSCHILSKQNGYYIVHFKELFALDGRSVDISEEDIGRRNTIAFLLEEWGMVKIKNPERLVDNRLPVSAIKVIKYADKQKYDLIPKYQIGNKRVIS